MKQCSVYESADIRKITGNTLRPGGNFLTDRAINQCHFPSSSRILDVGCGMGATVERLSDVFGLNAYGIDPSLKLLELGREKYGDLQTTLGKGEELPYPDSFFDGVFAECSMSLMEDYRKAILESRRVLQCGGYYMISDVYARKPEHLNELQRQKVNSCMRGLFHIDDFKEALVHSGFEILSCEDWTDLLKQLMVKIIFQYGSMSVFWEMATCSSCGDFQEKLTKCKPGYFLLIARKR